MPAKGKRVAARQAQLNRRRRRQARAVGEDGMQTAGEEGGSATATMVRPAAVSTSAQGSDAGQGQPSPAPAPARPPATSAAQGRNAQPMAYTHLPRELRRILILAAIVTAVLIGLSFVV